MNKKIASIFISLFCIYLTGCCSIPRTENYTQLISFTKVTQTVDLGLGVKKKVVEVKDFRESERYEEDMDELKAAVEQYISLNSDLSELRKNNLRALKVIGGTPKADVELLLGKPDKAEKLDSEAPYSASDLWIYRVNKPATFTVVFLPVLFAKQGCYIYFKDNSVAAMERHYLEQTFWSSSSGTSDKGGGGKSTGLF